MHLLTQSALLQALGWTLVNSLWQMGLLWLTWILLTALFHQSPARFRHGLALTLLGFGALGSMVSFVANYFFGNYFFDDGGRIIPGVAGWGTIRLWIPLILPYCSSLYLLVLGGLLFRYFHLYLQSRRLTREGLTRAPAEFRVFVASTSRLMGIKPAVTAWLSSRVDVPMTLGSLKPIILLPAAMISNLSPQQVEAILVHELAHIRRQDYLVHLGVTVIGLLFFFNPFARLLIRQLHKEREHCCDDEVLQFRYDPHAYVSALLSLARLHRPARLALAATGNDDQLLLQRARMILQQKRTDRRPGARPFILLFITAAITLFSISTPPRPQVALARQPQPANRQSAETVFIPIVNLGVPGQAAATQKEPLRKVAKAGQAKQKQLAGSNDEPIPAEAELPGPVASSYQPSMRTRQATLLVPDMPAHRDNSLGGSDDNDNAADDADPAEDEPAPAMESLVFVPNSSFSFKQLDTLRPEDKLTWIEENSEKEIQSQVERLEKELRVQSEVLRRQEARTRTLSSVSQKEIRQLLNDQIQLQRDYLRKLNDLQLRLKKTVHHRTTVYI
jgi:beta-lactamase regulating signal transducer with metallopeptidase domain